MKPIYWVLIIVAAIVLIYGYNQGWFSAKKPPVTTPSTSASTQTLSGRISNLISGGSSRENGCGCGKGAGKDCSGGGQECYWVIDRTDGCCRCKCVGPIGG